MPEVEAEVAAAAFAGRCECGEVNAMLFGGATGTGAGG
jgi:hypothetical protein